jgi:hypothetical protein
LDVVIVSPNFDIFWFHLEVYFAAIQLLLLRHFALARQNQAQLPQFLQPGLIKQATKNASGSSSLKECLPTPIQPSILPTSHNMLAQQLSPPETPRLPTMAAPAPMVAIDQNRTPLPSLTDRATARMVMVVMFLAPMPEKMVTGKAC